MDKYKIDESKYSPYRDTKSGLLIAIEKKEEKRFQKLVKDYKDVENIPDKEMVKGIFLKEINGVHEMIDEYLNEAQANKLKFPNI